VVEESAYVRSVSSRRRADEKALERLVVARQPYLLAMADTLSRPKMRETGLACTSGAKHYDTIVEIQRRESSYLSDTRLLYTLSLPLKSDAWIKAELEVGKQDSLNVLQTVLIERCRVG
jgi:hypothetical protein